MSKLDFYDDLKHYFDNDQECLIALNDGSIFVNCRIIKIDKKLQFTCDGEFLDYCSMIDRCELIIKIKDIKYIGRSLPNLIDVEDEDFNDDLDDDDEDEESII